MQFHRLLLIVFTIFSFGCSNQANFSPDEVSSNSNDISSDLLRWNKRQKITLLPHQLIPINYLEKNSDIKGLLVYHYLGTGKTYLALGFAERNQSKKIVVLAPRFLKGHWLKNMRSYGVKNPSRYKIVTHTKPDSLIKT